MRCVCASGVHRYLHANRNPVYGRCPRTHARGQHARTQMVPLLPLLNTHMGHGKQAGRMDRSPSCDRPPPRLHAAHLMPAVLQLQVASSHQPACQCVGQPGRCRSSAWNSPTTKAATHDNGAACAACLLGWLLTPACMLCAMHAARQPQSHSPPATLQAPTPTPSTGLRAAPAAAPAAAACRAAAGR